jgi:hypothetical protein
MPTRHPTGASPLVTSVCSLAVLLFLFVATPAAHAQQRSGPISEVRAPEVVVHIGRFRAGSDEGAIGQGVSYGATVSVPISRWFVADLDYQTSTVVRSTRFPSDVFTYRTRRTLILPSVLYRFGREVVSGFIGGGMGAELDDSRYTGLVEEHTSELKRVTSFRGGVVAFPTRKLGMRAELYTAGWHLGARIGVGYRF